MSSYCSPATCLTLALCSVTVFAQSRSAAPAVASSAPVAYVYVSTLPNVPGGIPSRPASIVAYAAAANGKLTPISGSPFADSASSMAVNGKYLFASNGTTAYDLNTYLMGTNGSLKKVQTLNDATASGSNPACLGLFQVLLDHTGSNLYVGAGDPDCDGASALQTFGVVKASGALKYYAKDGPDKYEPSMNTISANDLYVYGTTFASGTSTIAYFKRGTNGSLMPGYGTITGPTPPQGILYYAGALQADPSNHLAAVESSYNTSDGNPSGKPDQLASYTIHSDGGLTTSSTSATMPSTAVQTAYVTRMAPSGKLLAVGGLKGLQIFHFNGASPLTADTGLLENNPVSAMYWDNANHLYAITSYYNGTTTIFQLYVFTVTPTSAVAAPGSPYPVPNAASLIVQPK